MYIRNTATDERPTRRLKTAQMDDYVEFNEDGIARVSRDVGEYLVSEFDNIVVEKEEGNGGVGDSTPDTDPEPEPEPEPEDVSESDAELQATADESVDADEDEFEDVDIEETD